jgi:hypothetical protein
MHIYVHAHLYTQYTCLHTAHKTPHTCMRSYTTHTHTHTHTLVCFTHSLPCVSLLIYSWDPSRSQAFTEDVFFCLLSTPVTGFMSSVTCWWTQVVSKFLLNKQCFRKWSWKLTNDWMSPPTLVQSKPCQVSAQPSQSLPVAQLQPESASHSGAGAGLGPGNPGLHRVPAQRERLTREQLFKSKALNTTLASCLS